MRMNTNAFAKNLIEERKLINMSLTSLVLKFAAPVPNIENYDRFLFVGPHPDDIEIGAGATAAKLAAMGKHVKFLICLDGRFGDEKVPAETSRDKLVEVRKREAIASAKMLGVDNVHFLGFSDGGFYDTEELTKAIAKEVSLFKPDIIFAPDPCVSSECHADHLNVGNAARQVAYFAPYPGIMQEYGAESCNIKVLAYYMTAKPNVYVKTTGYINRQIDAVFSSHLSQFPIDCADAKTISLYIKLRSVDYGIRSLKGSAEGFRALGRVHMHCLPESGK